MPYTPDRFPGVRRDEALILDKDSIQPTQDGEIRYVQGEGFRFHQEGSPLTLGTADLSKILFETSGGLIYDSSENIVTRS